MLIESGKTPERHFYIFCWYIAYLMYFENTHEPPVAVAIIHQDEAGLAFDSCGKALVSRPDRSRWIHWGFKERMGDPRWEGEWPTTSIVSGATCAVRYCVWTSAGKYLEI